MAREGNGRKCVMYTVTTEHGDCTGSESSQARRGRSIAHAPAVGLLAYPDATVNAVKAESGRVRQTAPLPLPTVAW